jgi:hypothetical protein
VDLPCGGKCKSDQVCLSDTCKSAQNLDCSADSTRCPSAFTCSNGRCKRSCTVDQDCPEPATCNIDLFICAECSLDSDCKDAARPHCDQSSGSCVGCIDNTQCRQNSVGAGKVCDMTTLTCEPGCNSLADCSPSTKDCQGGSETVAGKCIECTGNIDCTLPGVGYCDTATNACVECLSNANCASNQCDLASHRCVECVDDIACGRGSVCNPQTFKCTPGCTNGSGSAECPPENPACDTSAGAFGTCVRCVENTDCPRAQVCQRGGTPTCVEGCDGDARCAADETDPTATNTICDPTKTSKGKCVQCRSDANCAQGLVCDSTSGSCRCKKAGEACSSTDECGSEVVNGDGSVTISCQKPATNNPYFCVTSVCGSSVNKSVPSVCSTVNKGGLPGETEKPGTPGKPCPPGFIVEWAKDANASGYVTVCVPNKSPYTCP